MKHLLKSGLFVFAAVLTLFALSVAVSAEPAQATVTLTETQINSSFRVTNPVYRRVTNLHVDLQPGQAVVSATVTLRAPRGQTTTIYQTVSTWIPSVVNGRVTWTLTSATANGSPASSQVISQLNAAIGTSWRAYWRGQHPGRVSAITVDDNQAVITYS